MAINRRPAQPLIYIAVGTVYQASLDFFKECLKAFAGEQYAVIMSVGRGTDPADLQPIPPNFTIGHYLPQLQILREADLFITHGGMNSISEAVMLETPMIVTPTTREQSVNAARVEKLKAGIFISPEETDAGKLTAAAQQILADNSYIAGVKRIRQSFVEAGGVKAGADAIDRFKQQNGLP
jgi:MGT family glycosyltransferase